MTAEYQTIKQAANALGVHWRTVYQWTRDGIIGFVQYREHGPIWIPISEISRLKSPKKSLTAK